MARQVGGDSDDFNDAMTTTTTTTTRRQWVKGTCLGVWGRTGMSWRGGRRSEREGWGGSAVDQRGGSGAKRARARELAGKRRHISLLPSTPAYTLQSRFQTLVLKSTCVTQPLTSTTHMTPKPPTKNTASYALPSCSASLTVSLLSSSSSGSLEMSPELRATEVCWWCDGACMHSAENGRECEWPRRAGAACELSLAHGDDDSRCLSVRVVVNSTGAASKPASLSSIRGSRPDDEDTIPPHKHLPTTHTPHGRRTAPHLGSQNVAPPLGEANVTEMPAFLNAFATVGKPYAGASGEWDA